MPWATACAVVNHWSAVVREESPVEVAVILVWFIDPSRPRSPIPTCCGADAVLVTTLIQRTKDPLVGTKTFRESWRFSDGKAWGAKSSWRFLPFIEHSSPASAEPGL